MRLSVIESEPRISIKADKQKGILSYDKTNAYPQMILQLIGSSGRAQSIISQFGRFVKAQGFLDEVFYRSIVGANGLTCDKLLRKTVKDYEVFKAFVWHINFNMLGEIVSVTPIPFKECRLGCDDEENYNGKIIHYIDWAKERWSNMKTKLVTAYDEFNPSKVLEQISNTEGGIQNYKGQIFWYSEFGMEYPVAIIDSVIENVAADSGIKDFNYNNITTNFLAFYFLYTSKCETDDQRNDYAKMIKNFQGGKRAGKFCHVEKDLDTDIFDLKKADIQDVDGLFKETEASVKEGIRQPYGVPPVLIGDLIAGKLATSSEIKDATDFYNWMTYDDRLVLEEEFRKVFSLWHDKNINPSINFSIKKLAWGEEDAIISKEGAVV